jgi:hypothetical protein
MRVNLRRDSGMERESKILLTAVIVEIGRRA